MIKPCIGREFAYFLKQEHLYSKYRMMRRNEKKPNGEEYVFWSAVYAKFNIFLIKKYRCENNVIIN